jgi:hypothetical protein
MLSADPKFKNLLVLEPDKEQKKEFSLRLHDIQMKHETINHAMKLK